MAKILLKAMCSEVVKYSRDSAWKKEKEVTAEENRALGELCRDIPYRR
jgi:hypothetical protein